MVVDLLEHWRKSTLPSSIYYVDAYASVLHNIDEILKQEVNKNEET